MKNIDIEKLMRECKIIYWKEDEICQENTIGIQDNIKNLENIDKPLVIQCNRGD